LAVFSSVFGPAAQEVSAVITTNNKSKTAYFFICLS
jgi:hypothetical protein